MAVIFLRLCRAFLSSLVILEKNMGLAMNFVRTFLTLA